MAETRKRTGIKQTINGLNDQQRRFVEEYAVDCNASAAVVRAGYQSAKPAVTAGQVMAVPAVRAAVEERLKLKRIRTEINADWVVSNFKRIFERCMQVEAVTDKEGNTTGEYRFDAKGANKALEMLGRSIGMFRNSDGRGKEGDGGSADPGAVQHVKVIINMPDALPMPSALKLPGGVIVENRDGAVSAIESVPALPQDKHRSV